jgi:Fe-S-cluster containining protein
MISPSQVKDKALKFKEQNLDFRSFLKIRADSRKLDEQFQNLHTELFARYDCTKCNNCCKSYPISLKADEIKVIAQFLEQREDDFIVAYLRKYEDGYIIRESPCIFLSQDGRCLIQSCKPAACQGYPYTDKPNRLSSMFSIIESAEVCPVVFEILKRLKAIYHFRT